MKRIQWILVAILLIATNAVAYIDNYETGNPPYYKKCLKAHDYNGWTCKANTCVFYAYTQDKYCTGGSKKNLLWPKSCDAWFILYSGEKFAQSFKHTYHKTYYDITLEPGEKVGDKHCFYGVYKEIDSYKDPTDNKIHYRWVVSGDGTCLQESDIKILDISSPISNPSRGDTVSFTVKVRNDGGEDFGYIGGGVIYPDSRPPCNTEW
ncbi:MAG: hypothetical protein KAU03_04310, partial [Candidatus Altiarchaeales archaeon]|nr:hypothetical protein [Candidatus Altiarchaeales archaeon]